jgi:hypothetical protein
MPVVAWVASREPAEQDGGQQDDVGGRGEPEPECLEARERDPLRPDQQRAKVLAERPQHDRRHHHHHHRAVLAHHHQILLGADDVIVRRQQLGPDRHGEQAAGQEVSDHAVQVLDAHYLVVQREPEVLGQAGPLLAKEPGLLGQRLAPHQQEEVVKDAQAGQPPDDRERVPQHDRDVVLVG